MAQFTLQRLPDQFHGPTGKKISGGWSFGSVITGGIFIFLGYLLLGGAIAWSTTLQWWAVGGVAAWLLLRRR